MEAGHLRENPQTPQQQETLQAITQETQRNNKKLTSSGFKQQPICTPLAPTRNKIIYKTACSNGHNSGSGRPSQNRLRKFRGHYEAGLLAFEALQGLPWPAQGTRTKRGSRGLESIYNTFVGVAVGHCGAFWTCKSIAVYQSCTSFGKKGHCRIKNIGLGLQEVVLPSCVEKLTVKLSLTDPLASCEDLLGRPIFARLLFLTF